MNKITFNDVIDTQWRYKLSCEAHKKISLEKMEFDDLLLLNIINKKQNDFERFRGVGYDKYKGEIFVSTRCGGTYCSVIKGTELEYDDFDTTYAYYNFKLNKKQEEQLKFLIKVWKELDEWREKEYGNKNK